MRVVHVNVVRPRGHPDPDALLDSWPTLANVADAVAGAGGEVTVIQSFHCNAQRIRGSARFHFVAEAALPGSAAGIAPWRIAARAKRCSPDIIHVNGLDYPAHTRALCRLNVPVLAQDHASRPGANRRRRTRALKGVAGVAFTAAAQAEPFVAEGSIATGMPIFSVPESSTGFGPAEREQARAQSGVSGEPALLWVGRLNENKDPLTVLDAVEQAAGSLPGLQLWCCFHEQPLLDAVRARISASPQLMHRVHLIGRVPHKQVEILCRAADFLMLASHHESAGFAAIEALACGATPILSDIPPFRALTRGGQVGALAAPGDSHAFARALISLAAKPREQLRRQALAHFENELSFARIGVRLMEIYADLTRAGG